MSGSFHRPPTAQEAVLAELRRAIGSAELAPGTQVLQDQLAERYGVSRVPLREALKVLEAEGQVTYHPHRGYFVAELSLADLLEVYRLRDLLESEAVRVGVPLLTDADVERVAQAAAACERAGAAGDLAARTEANRALHFGLLEAAGMPRLVRLVRVLWDATDAYRSRYYAHGATRAVVDAEHRAVLAAVRHRDADAVTRLLREHREHAVEHLRGELAAQAADAAQR